MEIDNKKAELAIHYAVVSHRDILDKDGKTPYVFHPLSVADKFKDDLVAYCAAVLHDTVEDSEMTIEEISKDFGSEVSEIVDIVTRRKNENYTEFIERVRNSGNERAIAIKRADMFDNIKRAKALASVDPKASEKLLTKYTSHIIMLGSKRTAEQTGP